MATFDSSQAFRYSADQMLAVPSILGVATYQSFITLITNDQVDINDTDTSRLVTSTRLLIADGYRVYAGTSDGYLNPELHQEKGEQLIISNGKLTANRLILGPLAFPYSLNGLSSGIDPQLFQPAIGSNNNNISLYVQIKGIGLNPNTNFFTVEEIILDDMANLLYRVVLKSNNLTIGN